MTTVVEGCICYFKLWNKWDIVQDWEVVADEFEILKLSSSPGVFSFNGPSLN